MKRNNSGGDGFRLTAEPSHDLIALIILFTVFTTGRENSKIRIESTASHSHEALPTELPDRQHTPSPTQPNVLNCLLQLVSFDIYL